MNYYQEIYSLPFRTSLDTKSREFQYKLLNRCLITNSFLNKIGIIPSPACSFCGEMNESLEHFFISCRYTKDFWAEVIKWFDNQGVKIKHLSEKDIMFGILRCEDELLINKGITLLFSGILFICVSVVSFAARARSAKQGQMISRMRVLIIQAK